MPSTDPPENLPSSSLSEETANQTLELLRPGVIFAGKYKITGRIPRWIAQRRFLGSYFTGSETFCLLVFSLPTEWRTRWHVIQPVLGKLRDPGLLPILEMHEFQGLQVLVTPEAEGVPADLILQTDGPMDPRRVRAVLFPVAKGLLKLQQAGIPLPSLSSGAILVPQDPRDTPVVFPLPLPSEHPRVPVLSASGSTPAKILRDLAYELSTGLPAPLTYDANNIQVVPSPLRDSWKGLFEEEPQVEDLLSMLSKAVVSELPPVRSETPASVLPPLRRQPPAGGEISSPPQQTPKSQFPVGERHELPFGGNRGDRGERPAWDVWGLLSTLAAIAAAAFVGWFCWNLVRDLSPQGTRLAGELFRFRQAENPASRSSETTPSTTSPLSASANPNLSRPLSPDFPMDEPDKPGSALSAWISILSAGPDAESKEAFAAYLERLEGEIDSLRAGKRPQMFAQIEQTANLGVAEAKFFLARVLWGRETHRSEMIVVALAKEGFEPAIRWCEQQRIEWK